MEQTLGLKAEQKIESVNNFKFEPILGRPMLEWNGKRPYTSTQYYPAQRRESYENQSNGWVNKLYWGDNLQVMSHLLKEYRGQVDLIYIDPPFDSKADYKMKIKLHGLEIKNDSTSFEEKQYTDIWTNDDYLQFMYERLILLRELLSEKGTLYLHCDWHKDHLLRCLIDEVFGASNFRNEIIWHYQTYQGQVKNFFPRKHDTILMVTKSKDWTFHMLKDEQVEKTIDFTRWNNFLNENNEITGANYPSSDSRFDGYLKRFIKENHRQPGPDDVILRLEGLTIDSVWDIKAIDPKNQAERLNYPTQKPEALLERIIKASSNPGDLVFDCFMGSGTTQAVAMKLGRRFIGSDINIGAMETSEKRLLKIQKDLEGKTMEDGNPYYTDFEVYNVNNYEVFNNPIQARDILIKALEIQEYSKGNVYDGELDGRMVKIMPMNRIATRVDLNDFLANLPLKVFEERKKKSLGKSVEDITLVCMGHEPDLAEYMKLEVEKIGYKIDVKVVDILRDKSKIEFKRDAEAEITIEGNKLVIRAFYPMNLLQKLSLEKQNVDEWRQLVDSIKIDFNYDGVILTPSVIDIADENDDNLVVGSYEIPQDASTIRIKITDVLSESFEKTIEL